MSDKPYKLKCANPSCDSEFWDTEGFWECSYCGDKYCVGCKKELVRCDMCGDLVCDNCKAKGRIIYKIDMGLDICQGCEEL